MDHYLIELLWYQVLDGNKVSDEFVAKALIEMVTDGKFGLTVTKMLWGIDTNIWGSNIMTQRFFLNIVGCLEVRRNGNLWVYVYDSYTLVNCHLFILVSLDNYFLYFVAYLQNIQVHPNFVIYK